MMNHSRDWWIRIALLAFVLLAAGAIRFALAPLLGHPFDTTMFLAWAEAMREHGLTAIYDIAITSFGFRVNYPPVFLYVLWGLAHTMPVLTISLLKLPAILVDLVLGWFVWRALHTQSMVRQFVGTAAVLLNPAVFLISSFWGQVDNLYTLFAALAVWAAARNRFAGAGALAALAVCTKLQAMVIIPVLVGLLLCTGSRRIVYRCTGGAVLTGLVLLAPFLVAGKFAVFVRPFLGAVKQYAYLTMNAMNVWWPVAHGKLVSDDVRFFGISAFAIGMGLVMVSWVWAGWWAMRRRNFSDTMFAAAFCALTFFFFATEMHERYVFPVFIFLPLTLGAYWRSGLALLGILTVPFIANITYVLIPYSTIFDTVSGASRFLVLDSWWMWYALAVLIMFVMMWRNRYAKTSHHPAGVQ